MLLCFFIYIDMRVITPNVEMCHPGYSLEEIKRHIVRCAQNCYKIDKYVDDPDEWIISRLLDKPEGEPQHTSPLAHGTIYLTIHATTHHLKFLDQIIQFYETNPYSRVVRYQDGESLFYYITTNYRVIYENKRGEDLQFLSKPNEKHIKRYTFKVNCDIGVSREANRHTTLTVSEQSTRYCNYSGDRFDNQLHIEMPTVFMKEDTLDGRIPDVKEICNDILSGKEYKTEDYWKMANVVAEYAYMNLIRLGWKPQQARSILPLDTHTEVYYTAFEDDWDHFIQLRDHKDAHPDMRLIARMIHNLIKENQNK